MGNAHHRYAKEEGLRHSWAEARARAALLAHLRCPRALARAISEGHAPLPETDQAIANDALAVRGLRAWIPPDPRAGALLIVRGRPPERPGVALVGARASDPYGIAISRRAALDAVEAGRSVISGGAEGCDSAAHQAAIEAKGHTFVVLGGGHDRPYPAHHRALFDRIVERGGGVASPYWPDTPPAKFRFLERNRVIVGLAAVVVVARAARKSGALTTGREALKMGRTVFAAPGALGLGLSEGTHLLLEQGAKPLTGSHTLRRALGESGGARWPVRHHRASAPWESEAEELIDGDLPKPARQALADIERHGTATLEGLVERTGLDLATLIDATLELQMRGLVAQNERGELWSKGSEARKKRRGHGR